MSSAHAGNVTVRVRTLTSPKTCKENHGLSLCAHVKFFVCCEGSQLKQLSGFKERTAREYENQRHISQGRPNHRGGVESAPSGQRRKKQRGGRDVDWRTCPHGNGCQCSQQEYLKSLGINTFEHAYGRVPHFQPVHCVPRDLMHVELEGTLKSHLSGVLYMAFKLKWFTLHAFNVAIRTWPFPSGKRPDIMHKKPEGNSLLAITCQSCDNRVM